MNILKEYTLDYMRRNKKSTFAALVAILIAATLLSALCGVLNTMHTDNIRLTIEEEGDWHGELYADTRGDRLKYVTGHPNVETVMIKGPWETAVIEDARRPYLLLRGLTRAYWSDMPEKDLIMEGRAPEQADELAVSKQYLESHPNTAVGDTLRLPVGRRTAEGVPLDSRAMLQENENFEEEEIREYTVVGIMDSTTNSLTPAYLAYGFLEESAIQPGDLLTVYMRFDHPRSAYEDMGDIARSVGFETDEYGDYPVRLHGGLLAKYFIFPPGSGEGGGIEWTALSLPLMYAGIAGLVTALFILIIYNAFALSADSRLRQLAILQSVGATPRQIGKSVVFEALVLSALAIPPGVLLGYGLDWLLFPTINQMVGIREEMEVVFTFGLPAVVPAVVLALLTVWISASIPAGRIRRMPLLQAIRQGGDKRGRRPGKGRGYLVHALFGAEGELAALSFSARRRSYRAAVISLTISFALLGVFLSMMVITDIQNRVLYDDRLTELPDLTVSVRDGQAVEEEFMEAVRNVPGAERTVFAGSVPTAVWVTQEQESPELRETGGLARAAETKRYYVWEEKGRFRIRNNLIALDDRTFADYCRRIGADPAPFYGGGRPRVVAVNQTKDDTKPGRREETFIPLLKLEQGDIFTCEEKVYKEDNTDFVFETEAEFVTEEMPPSGTEQGKYTINQVMPLSVYNRIVEGFQEERRARARYTNVYVTSADGSERGVKALEESLIEEVGGWYGSGDYESWNRPESDRVSQMARDLLSGVMTAVAAFLACIGVANAFATVSGNLRQRGREFAMLRSMGMSPGGIRCMLALEALFFGMTPILLALPIYIAFAEIYRRMCEVYFVEYWKEAPYLPMLLFAWTILFSIFAAYSAGSRSLIKANIVDGLKDETM